MPSLTARRVAFHNFADVIWWSHTKERVKEIFGMTVTVNLAL